MADDEWPDIELGILHRSLWANYEPGDDGIIFVADYTARTTEGRLPLAQAGLLAEWLAGAAEVLDSSAVRMQMEPFETLDYASGGVAAVHDRSRGSIVLTVANEDAPVAATAYEATPTEAKALAAWLSLTARRFGSGGDHAEP